MRGGIAHLFRFQIYRDQLQGVFMVMSLFRSGRTAPVRALCASGSALLMSALVAFSLSALHTPASAGTLERVAETGKFRIGYRYHAPPYSYVANDGKISGYIVDLCREVARNVQSALKLPKLDIEYVEVSAEDRTKVVSDGRVDVLCDPFSMTMSRRAHMDFSLPTFLDGASVVTRGPAVKGIEDLKGRQIGVLKNTTTEETLRKTLTEMQVPATVITVNDHPEGLRMLAEGKLDAYFGDRGILNYLITHSPYSRELNLSDQYFTFETYALPLPRGDNAFRLLVDGTLADLYRSERVRNIYANTFGEFPPDQFLNALFIINGVPK